MLTEADTLKWLERRENRYSATGYYISLWDFPGKTLFVMTERPNYKDAAEFEARVAAKLARGVTYGELPCGADPDCPDKNMDKYNTKETPLLGCQMCVLRAARLAVETGEL